MWGTPEKSALPLPALLSPSQAGGSPLRAMLSAPPPSGGAPALGLLLQQGGKSSQQPAASQQHGKNLLDCYDSTGYVCTANLGAPFRPTITPVANLAAPPHSGVGALAGTGAVVRAYRVSPVAIRAMALCDNGLKSLIRHDSAVSDMAILPALPGREVEVIASADCDGSVLLTAFEVHGGADRFAMRSVARLVCEGGGAGLPTLVRWHPGLRGQLIVTRGQCVWLRDLLALGIPEEVFGLGPTPQGQITSPVGPDWLTHPSVTVALSMSTASITVADGPVSDLDVVSTELGKAGVAAHGAPHHVHAAGWDVGNAIIALLVNSRTSLYSAGGAKDAVHFIGQLPARAEAPQTVRILRSDSRADRTPDQWTARFAVAEAAANSVVLTTLATDPGTGTLAEGSIALEGPRARVLTLAGTWGADAPATSIVRLAKLAAGDCGALLAVGNSTSDVVAVFHALPPGVTDVTRWAGQWRWVHGVSVSVGQSVLAMDLAPPLTDAALLSRTTPTDGSPSAAWSLAVSTNLLELLVLHTNGTATMRVPLSETLLGGQASGATAQVKAGDKDLAGAVGSGRGAAPARVSSASPSSVQLPVARVLHTGLRHEVEALRPRDGEELAKAGTPARASSAAAADTAHTAPAPPPAPAARLDAAPAHTGVPSLQTPSVVRGQNSPAPVSAPAPVLHAPPTPAPATATAPSLFPLLPAPSPGGAPDALLANVSEVLRVALSQISVDAGKREAKAQEENKSLIEAIAMSMTTLLPSAIESAVAKALSPLGAVLDAQHAAVVTALEERVKGAVSAAMGDVGPQMAIATHIQPHIKTAMRAASQEMSASLKATATDAFKTAFETTLVPAFERGVSAMVVQVHTRMEADAQSVRTSMQASSEQLTRAAGALDAAASALRGHASTAAALGPLLDAVRTVQEQQAAAAQAMGKASAALQQKLQQEESASADMVALRAEMGRLMDEFRGLARNTAAVHSSRVSVPTLPVAVSAAHPVQSAGYGQQHVALAAPQPQAHAPSAALPTTPSKGGESGANLVLAAALRSRQEGTSSALQSLLAPAALPAAAPPAPAPAPPTVPMPSPVSEEQNAAAVAMAGGRVADAIRIAIRGRTLDVLTFVVQACAAQAGDARKAPGPALSSLEPFERLCVLQRASMILRPTAGVPTPVNNAEVVARAAWLEATVIAMSSAGDTSSGDVKDNWPAVAAEARSAAEGLHTMATTAGPVDAQFAQAASTCARRVLALLQ